MAASRRAKLTAKRRVVQVLFHRRIGQTEPLLQEVNAQHGLDGKGRAVAFGARAHLREWLDQTHQFCSRDDKTHLIEKHTLARALGNKLQSVGGKADLFHVRSTTFRKLPLSGFCRPSLSYPGPHHVPVVPGHACRRQMAATTLEPASPVIHSVWL